MHGHHFKKPDNVQLEIKTNFLAQPVILDRREHQDQTEEYVPLMVSHKKD